MAGKQGANGTTATGPDAVEALANPMAAGFVNALLTEARAALEEKYGAELSATRAFGLKVLKSHGEQLVTATAPAQEGAP